MNTRIKAVREATTLSQTEFGKKIGLSQNYIWMLERQKSARKIGNRNPKGGTA